MLEGYSNGTPLHELERRTHVTGKTIRATYQALRSELRSAVPCEPNAFGGAGHILFYRDALRHEAEEFLSKLGQIRLYRRYRTLHAPRLQQAEDEHALIFELAIRIFCAIDLRAIDQSAPGWEGRILNTLAVAVRNHRSRDPLSGLAEEIPGARPHLHAPHRMFENYRRYLAANPLGRRSK